jgi:bifunctional DNA-binding transcriptional regulator/antitoxin component of YhaV-PrlF toxin-antitoxin module
MGSGGDKMKINMDDVDYITETSVTIRGSRRRTTVPKYIVDKLDIKDGDKMRWLLFKDGTVMIVKIYR